MERMLASEVQEGEDAFALSPCIGKFMGLDRPLRGRIDPLVAAKRTSVELMALKSNISNPIGRVHVGAKGRTVCYFAPDNVRISSTVLQRSTLV